MVISIGGRTPCAPTSSLSGARIGEPPALPFDPAFRALDHGIVSLIEIAFYAFP